MRLHPVPHDGHEPDGEGTRLIRGDHLVRLQGARRGRREAQLDEQRSHTPSVEGSTPSSSTMEAVVVPAARRDVAPVDPVRSRTVSPSAQASQRSGGAYTPTTPGAAPGPATTVTFRLPRASSSSLEEHPPRKRKAPGSSPGRSTLT